MISYQQLWQSLTPLYEASEAQAIIRLMLDVRFGLSLTDIICGKVNELSADEEGEVRKIILRLQKAEPIQYILGEAEFAGHIFHVEPGVLIPRPETAELVDHIIASSDSCSSHVLDICTGSGCIAISIALALPHSSVSAWDISDDALRVAKMNAERIGANILFERRDALSLMTFSSESTDIEKEKVRQWDVIVSNPPYICEKEKCSMAKNVLDYEPDIALFVPDEDPLLFYRKITEYARESLQPHGTLYFEINPLYAEATKRMIEEHGFQQVEIIKDMQQKERMIKARK